MHKVENKYPKLFFPLFSDLFLASHNLLIEYKMPWWWRWKASQGKEYVRECHKRGVVVGSGATDISEVLLAHGLSITISVLKGYMVLVWYPSGKYDQGWKEPLQFISGLHFFKPTLHLFIFFWSELIYFPIIIFQMISKVYHMCSLCMLLCSFVAYIINKLHTCLMCVLPAGIQTPSEQKLRLPYELRHHHCLSLCYVYVIASVCNFLIFSLCVFYGSLCF